MRSVNKKLKKELIWVSKESDKNDFIDSELS